MIRLHDVTKTFATAGRRKVVLDRVSAEFPKNRNLALIGPNGAGKSTLLRMIGGSIEPDSGEIERQGRISWPIGLRTIFQGALTGAQNARFIARIYAADTDDMVEKVAAFADLGPDLHEPTGNYSSGMKARLAFACSIAIPFDVYLVDEITAVGDAAFRKRCNQAFRDLKENKSLIMVSHSDGSLRAHCDMGVVIERGRLTFFEEVEDALEVHAANMNAPQNHRR
ncbi:MAG: ABC transporter ATP-binding protein [Pseudomonadota bacterium]